ncbi:MAG TPA: COX15/CtaA family protein [Thermoplasmata archaeon]|nr:COX15/CtaA family protein [Thermoplasmata archaeon]
MRGHDFFRIAAVVALVLCYTTIILGGNVITTDNGLACPDWPTCFGNGNFFPAFSGGAAIEWSHRVAAFFLSASVLVLTLLGVAFERGRRVLLKLSFGALALVVTEALLGGVVIETSLLAGIVLLHLAIATVLFGILLVLTVLANLKEMPRRWIEWARRASEEDPQLAAAAARAASAVRPSRPAERPIPGAAPRDG